LADFADVNSKAVVNLPLFLFQGTETASNCRKHASGL
jgi:hypothetical protein